MKHALIEAVRLSKVYESDGTAVHALRQVNLKIERGEMVAIMGPSGCGKSTLLYCLAGLEQTSGGKVLLEGKDLQGMSDRARTAYRASRMGFVFQAYNLIPVLTNVENAELPLLAAGLRPKEARTRALALLDRLGLADMAHRMPAQISGGQQQRVAIARALVSSPAILWADEPTGALDSKTSQETMDLLRTVNRELQQTIVIITHDLQVGMMGDRILHMRDGQIEREQLIDHRHPALAEA